MKWYLFILLAFVFVVIEVAFPSSWQLGDAHPELALLLAIYVILNGEPEDTIFAAWLVGFTKDLFSTGRLGTHALIYFFGAIVLLKLRKYFYREEILVQSVVAFVAVLAASLLYLLQLNLDLPGTDVSQLIRRVFVVSLYSAACAPIIYLLLDAISRPVGIYQKRRLY